MISVVHPYWNAIETFRYQFSKWSKLSDHAKANFEFVVVDDGSQEHPCVPPKHLHGVDLKILRIEDDIPWNTAGAANLGVSQAKYDWIFHMDFDKGLSGDNPDKILQLDFSDPMKRYRIQCLHTTTNRRGVTKHKWHKPHCNSYIMHKDIFWEIGGYDEDFGGGYGHQDSLFLDECRAMEGLEDVRIYNRDGNAPFIDWNDGRPECEDSQCKTWGNRRSSRRIPGGAEMGQDNSIILQEKRRDPSKRNYEILRFQWHQVYPVK
jgi:predicted glycosyltransferase involved in capsule biosynthesis